MQKPHRHVRLGNQDHEDGPLRARGLGDPKVPLSEHLLGDDVARGMVLPLRMNPPRTHPGGHLDPMRCDVDLAESPRQ